MHDQWVNRDLASSQTYVACGHGTASGQDSYGRPRGWCACACRQATGADYHLENVNSALNTIKVEGPEAWALVRWGDAEHLEGIGFAHDGFGGGQADG